MQVNSDMTRKEIPPPFSILGSTQVPYAARLLYRMDQGHGLLDRFTFIFPVCLRPSTAETETARSWLESDEVWLKQFSAIFIDYYASLNYHASFLQTSDFHLKQHKHSRPLRMTLLKRSMKPSRMEVFHQSQKRSMSCSMWRLLSMYSTMLQKR